MGSAMRRDARAGAGRGKRRQAQNCGDRSGAGHRGAVEGLVGWSRRNFVEHSVMSSGFYNWLINWGVS